MVKKVIGRLIGKLRPGKVIPSPSGWVPGSWTKRVVILLGIL